MSFQAERRIRIFWFYKKMDPSLRPAPFRMTPVVQYKLSALFLSFLLLSLPSAFFPVILPFPCHAAFSLSFCLFPVILPFPCHAAFLLSCCLSPVMLPFSCHAAFFLSCCLFPVILNEVKNPQRVTSGNGGLHFLVFSMTERDVIPGGA